MIFKIAFFYFFYFASVAVYVMYMPSLLKDIGYTALEIGIVFAASPLARFIAPFFFISILKLDRNIFYLSLFISLICGFLVYFFIENFYILLVLMIIMGFFWSTILPFIEVLALERIKKEKYGKARLFGSIGFILVGLALGQGSLELGITMQVYIVSIVMTFISGIVLGSSIEKEIEKKKFALSKEMRYFFWISLFLVQVSFGFFYNFFTIYELKAGIELNIISYFWAFGVLAEIIMFQLQSKVMHFNMLFLIKLSILVTVFRWLLVHFFSSSTYIIYFSQSLHAFSFALLHSASITYINVIYKNKQLAQQFYLGLTFGFGAFAGSVISGMLYGENLFLYASLIALLAFVLIYFEKGLIESKV